jgi:transketolase
MMTGDELDELAINTIHTLSIDAVQQAETGHPRTPMALAPLVHVLWNEALGGTRTQMRTESLRCPCWRHAE